MSEVKWFKITSNVFDDQKIKAMELMPDGDTIIVIWFKMIALAAQSNQNGIVMFTENIPYTEDLLISYLGKKDTTTRLALETFKNWGMLSVTDEQELLIKNFNKYQNVKGLDDIREQNRIRQQNYRDKQKILLLDNKKNKDNKNIDIRENNVKRNVTKQFVIPTIEQIEEYCKERNNNVNANKFFDFYESKGWLVGKNKMKNWKASVRTWENSKNTKEEPLTDRYKNIPIIT